jgi:hypothetical protein
MFQETEESYNYVVPVLEKAISSDINTLHLRVD